MKYILGQTEALEHLKDLISASGNTWEFRTVSHHLIIDLTLVDGQQLKYQIREWLNAQGGFMMKTTELIQKLRDIFFQRLHTKTAWGRNEVQKAYNESVEELMFDMLDAKEDT